MEVLVVDDDPVARILMTRLLSRLGCKVSTAENGETALRMILGTQSSTPTSWPYTRERPPYGSHGGCKYAVVFLDNHMPGLSGHMTVAKLRELKRRDFVVGVTGRRLPRFPTQRHR